MTMTSEQRKVLQKVEDKIFPEMREYKILSFIFRWIANIGAITFLGSIFVVIFSFWLGLKLFGLGIILMLFGTFINKVLKIVMGKAVLEEVPEIKILKDVDLGEPDTEKKLKKLLYCVKVFENSKNGKGELELF